MKGIWGENKFMLLTVHFLFILLSAFILADRQEKKMVETIPVVFSVLILALYVLAFFNRMWLIDYLSLSGVLAGIFFLGRERQSQKFARQLLEPSFLIFAAVTAVGMVLVSARGVAYFDDFHFWAVDIKSIYSLQGYAAKGFNCAAAFGDYPPAMQLVAAWVMHCLGEFREGYITCGYFLILQVYMAPLLARVPRRADVCLGAFIWMFVLFTFGPNILEGYSPDPLMGMMYGAVLVLVCSGKENTDSFDYFNIASVLSVLILTKSIGIQWAIFAVVFMAGQMYFQKRRLQFRHILWMLLPLCTWLSWYLFCKLFDRTTYLVANLQAETSDGLFRVFESDLFKSYGKELFHSFVAALFRKQQSGILGIGLSTVFCFAAFLVVILIFRKIQLLNTSEFRWVLGFTALSGIIEYGILLVSVETMFLAEYGNYTNVDNMVLLVKRYGCPYVIGTTMLLLHILFQRLDRICLSKDSGPAKKSACRVWLAVIAVSIAIAPVSAIWERYVSYREAPWLLEREPAERYANYPVVLRILDTIDTAREDGNQKILLITDGNVSFDPLVVQYYAAPFPVVVENGANGRVMEWNSLLRYYRCTAVCFVGDDTDGIFLSGIETAEGDPVVPYTIY